MQTFTVKLTNVGATLTAYLLDHSHEMPNTHTRPAVLIMPGGAYRGCSDREGEPVAMAFLAEGFHAFILRYSVNENAVFPKPLNDAEEALERIRQNCGDWGIDPGKVAVCGFSAGGHLAAALGTMGRVRPNAMILAYPCILASMSSIFPSPVPGVDELVDDSAPPAFIFHTFADTLVPVSNALAMASALERSKVPFELHIFKNGVHGLSLAKPVTSSGLRYMADSDSAKWFGLCIAWIKNVFGEFDSDREHMLNEDIREYSLDVQLGVLWKNETCKTIIQTALPILVDSSQLQDAMQVPLKVIIEYGTGLLTKGEMDILDQQLRAVKMG